MKNYRQGSGPAALVLALVSALSSTSVFAAPVDHCGQITDYELSNTFTGNTIASFGNDYKVNTCAGTPGAPWLPNSGASTEQVVRLRVRTACTLQLQVTGQASGGNFMDPSIYLANTCPPRISQQTILMDSSCLASADATGALGVETISVAVQPDQDYFFFIDGFLAANGPYTVVASGCELTNGEVYFQSGFE